MSAPTFSGPGAIHWSPRLSLAVIYVPIQSTGELFHGYWRQSFQDKGKHIWSSVSLGEPVPWVVVKEIIII